MELTIAVCPGIVQSWMEVRIEDAELRKMAADSDYSGRWALPVVRAFRECVWLINAAKDERDIYEIGGFRFEKLKGDHKGRRSLRLNRQWRLVVTLKKERGGNKLVVVHGIEDYH